jgi:dinuclear metal center YbgI/SA1388 family protein
MMKLQELVDYTGQVLQVERFRDYCPNGLQVEGRQSIRKIVTGVTASMDLLEAAHAQGADLILVHHGYFWRNEDPTIVGIKQKRIRFLLRHDLNLVAYHLPLDAHPEFGNNVQLGRRLGLEIQRWVGDPAILAVAQLEQAVTLEALAHRISEALHRTPIVIGKSDASVRRIAWCTGAAQSSMELAIREGVDVFVSGEISEQTVHLARESGVAYIAAGHHATERYGVQALGQHLADQFDLEHVFIDIDNPV